MYCSKCGSKVKENAKFCGICGAPIVELQVTEKPIAKRRKEKKSNRPGKKKKLIAAVIITIIILLFAGGGYYVATQLLGSNDVLTWQEQYELGEKYLNAGDYDKAILAFETAMEINPKSADTYVRLASTYVAKGDTAAAIEVVEQGVEEIGGTQLAEWAAENLISSENKETEEEAESNKEEEDAADYLTIYQKVIDQYMELEANEFAWEWEYDEIGRAINLGYLNDILILHSGYYEPGEFQVYYALEDIDKNGVPELFIGGSGNTEYGITIYDLFFCDGEDVIRLYDLWSPNGGNTFFGERVCLTVYTDGTFEIFGSNGAADSGSDFYKMGDDGCSIELLEQAQLKGDMGTGEVHFYALTGEVTETEYYDILDSYGSKEQYDIQWHEMEDYNNTKNETDTASINTQRLVQENQYSNDGDLQYVTNYTYGENGQLISELSEPEIYDEPVHYIYENGKLVRKDWVAMGTDYIYDEGGRLIEAYEVGEGEFEASYSFNYDYDGHVSGCVQESNYSDVPGIYTYSYDVDETVILCQQGDYTEKYIIHYRYGFQFPMILSVCSNTNNTPEYQITVFAKDEGSKAVLADRWLVDNGAVPVISLNETYDITYDKNGVPIQVDTQYWRLEFSYENSI